jgi:hypothetical protein
MHIKLLLLASPLPPRLDCMFEISSIEAIFFILCAFLFQREEEKISI